MTAGYQRAADVADKLLAAGLPVVNFTALAGEYVAISFQLQGDRALYVAKVPMGEATPEKFRELYEAVA